MEADLEWLSSASFALVRAFDGDDSTLRFSLPNCLSRIPQRWSWTIAAWFLRVLEAGGPWVGNHMVRFWWKPLHGLQMATFSLLAYMVEIAQMPLKKIKRANLTMRAPSWWSEFRQRNQRMETTTRGISRVGSRKRPLLVSHNFAIEPWHWQAHIKHTALNNSAATVSLRLSSFLTPFLLLLRFRF